VPIDPATLSRNREERERLRALVDRLSDEDLRRPIGPNWTVADALAHVAFWDRRALVLLERLEQGGTVGPSFVDVDVVNDAVFYLARRIPPRAAAEEAVAAAESIDARLEAAPADLTERNLAARGPLRLDRASHRREHRDEIERSLPAPSRP
jgi:hypothetical protein